MLEFVKFAYVLVSHPCDWAFAYRADDAAALAQGTRGHAVVVVPGLNRLSDSTGGRLATPLIVASPVVA